MKGDITLRILEALSDTAMNIVDGFAAFLEAGYGASPAKMNYYMGKSRVGRVKNHLARENIQKYYVAISKLKRDGLLEEKLSGGKKILALTSKGFQKINFLKKRKSTALPPIHFEVEKSNTIVMIIFDIPEQERRKRNWLRIALIRLGMRMIQKSVWIGKVKVPKEFLGSLRNMNLMPYVEIVEITKTGTLKNLGNSK